MRILLTVVGEHGGREVAVEADEGTTVGKLGDALRAAMGERLATVVRLPRSRAPYGMDRAGARAAPRETGAGLWSGGRALDPDARVAGLLRDGDLVALEARHATATVLDEPGGIVEVRVVGGPGAGAVHRLGPGAHLIGSAPTCAIVVRDPELPEEAMVVRVTPSGTTVEPAGRGALGGGDGEGDTGGGGDGPAAFGRTGRMAPPAAPVHEGEDGPGGPLRRKSMGGAGSGVPGGPLRRATTGRAGSGWAGGLRRWRPPCTRTACRCGGGAGWVGWRGPIRFWTGGRWTEGCPGRSAGWWCAATRRSRWP
ncbi:hypothetical protein [Thermocatellispora tengchongensis]|uniref:hypothetical protein n=1 Tax=Thermocatellispora tengchongensis TaxID=1073253 RepID=UPI00363F9995